MMRMPQLLHFHRWVLQALEGNNMLESLFEHKSQPSPALELSTTSVHTES